MKGRLFIGMCAGFLAAAPLGYFYKVPEVVAQPVQEIQPFLEVLQEYCPEKSWSVIVEFNNFNVRGKPKQEQTIQIWLGHFGTFQVTSVAELEQILQARDQ